MTGKIDFLVLINTCMVLVNLMYVYDLSLRLLGGCTVTVSWLLFLQDTLEGVDMTVDSQENFTLLPLSLHVE